MAFACILCQNAMYVLQPILVTACGHLFHDECLKTYFQQRVFLPVKQCPSCQRSVNDASDIHLLNPVQYQVKGQTSSSNSNNAAQSEDHQQRIQFYKKQIIELTETIRTLRTEAKAKDDVCNHLLDTATQRIKHLELQLKGTEDLQGIQQGSLATGGPPTASPSSVIENTTGAHNVIAMVEDITDDDEVNCATPLLTLENNTAYLLDGQIVDIMDVVLASDENRVQVLCFRRTNVDDKFDTPDLNNADSGNNGNAIASTQRLNQVIQINENPAGSNLIPQQQQDAGRSTATRELSILSQFHQQRIDAGVAVQMQSCDGLRYSCTLSSGSCTGCQNPSASVPAVKRGYAKLTPRIETAAAATGGSSGTAPAPRGQKKPAQPPPKKAAQSSASGARSGVRSIYQTSGGGIRFVNTEDQSALSQSRHQN